MIAPKDGKLVIDFVFLMITFLIHCFSIYLTYHNTCILFIKEELTYIFVLRNLFLPVKVPKFVYSSDNLLSKSRFNIYNAIFCAYVYI